MKTLKGAILFYAYMFIGGLAAYFLMGTLVKIAAFMLTYP